jgi:K+-sensing histidine kinase KdpD
MILGPVREALERKLEASAEVEIHTKVGAGGEDQVAAQIIEEAKKGGYDTIVLGKWGTRKLTAFLWGEVTAKVVHRVQGCSVWIVDNASGEAERDRHEESAAERGETCAKVS